MSLRLALPAWSAAKRESHHLGLFLSPGRLAAAVIRDGGPEKPRLVAYESFQDDPSLLQVRRWLKQKRLAVTSVNLLLANADYQMLTMDTPMVPAAERAEAMRWRIKDLIDFPVEEACVDCLVVPSPNGEPEGANSWAVVARRALVRERMASAEAAGLTLTSVDIPELALRNLLALEPTPQATALLCLTPAGGALIVVWRGELCSFRSFIDLTASHFSAADILGRQALLERLALDLQRTADAFERQFYGTSIDRVWIEQSVPGLDLVQQLAPHVSIRLQSLDLTERLELPQPASNSPSVDPKLSLIAVGAALREVLSAREAVAA